MRIGLISDTHIPTAGSDLWPQVYAAHVTPGVIQPGSPNQALNPENSINPPRFIPHHAFPTADGTRLFIEDELFADPGDEPVQMWDISDPANPSYVDGIAVGGTLMPVVNFAHNLEVRYDLDLDGDGSPDDRLYVGWYKAGLGPSTSTARGSSRGGWTTRFRRNSRTMSMTGRGAYG